MRAHAVRITSVRFLIMFCSPLLALACGQSGSSGSNPNTSPVTGDASPYDASPGDAWPDPAVPDFADPFVVLTSPVKDLSTNKNVLSIRGLAVGPFQSLRWDLRTTSGQTLTGPIPVREEWRVEDVELSPGDNRITVTGTLADGRTVSDSRTITHHEDLSLGPVSVSPRHIIVNAHTPVEISLRVSPASLLTGDGVRVLPVDAEGNPSGGALGTLKDDGQAPDVAAGDGLYTGLVLFPDDTKQTHWLRVMASLVDLDPALSERFDVQVMAPISPTEYAQFEDSRRVVPERYLTLKTTMSVHDALVQIATELKAMPGVASAAVSEADELCWTMHSGPMAVFSEPSPLTRGPSPVEAVPGLLMEPFHSEFRAYGGDEAPAVDSILKTWRCPPANPVEMKLDLQVTRALLKTLNRYRLIMIDTHGGVSSLSNEVYFMIEEPFDKSWIDREGSEDWWDIKLHRVGAKWLGKRNGEDAWGYAIGPKFISHYNPALQPGTVVHSSACSGARNQTMARAFLQSGAAAYTAFTNTVYGGYALAIVKAYTTALGQGKTVGEAVKEARKQAGPRDPDSPSTQLVSVPANSQAMLNLGCNGHTRITDDADKYIGGPDTAHTEYFSLDSLVSTSIPGGDPEYRVKAAFRSCTFTRTSGKSSDSGRGVLQDLYSDYRSGATIDSLERRSMEIKLTIDRTARTAKVRLVPEPGLFADDNWVTWSRISSYGTSSTEMLGCPFYGPARDLPAPMVMTLTESQMTLTDTHIQATVPLQSDKGTSIIEIDYQL